MFWYMFYVIDSKAQESGTLKNTDLNNFKILFKFQIFLFVLKEHQNTFFIVTST